MTQLTDDYRGGGSLDVGNDEHIPDGFVTCKGRVERELLKQMQRGSRAPGSYFRNKHVDGWATYNIERGEFVYGIDYGYGQTGYNSGGKRHYGQAGGYYCPSSVDGAVGGEAIVFSALNGIESLIGVPDGRTGMDPDLFAQYVLFKIRVIGQAITRVPHTIEETSGRAFGIQFGGIGTRVAKGCPPVVLGEYIRYAIPSHDAFTHPSWSMEEGIEPAKIGLTVCPVRECDAVKFAIMCLAISHRQGAVDTGKCITSQTSLGTVLFGRNLEAHALVCGLNFVYRLLQYGILRADSPIVVDGMDIDQYLYRAGVHGQANNPFPAAELRDLGLKESSNHNAHPVGANLAQSDLVRPKIVLKTGLRNTGDMKNGAAVFYTANNGQNFEAAMNNLNMQTTVENVRAMNIKSYKTPEQTVAIIANMMGILDCPNASTDESGIPAYYKIGEAINAATGAQRTHFENAKSDFFSSLFHLERNVDSGALAGEERVEVGNFTDRQKLAKYEIPGSERALLKYAPADNIYGNLNDMFENSLGYMMSATTAVTGFHKSLVFAKATRNGNEEKALDFMMVN